MAGQEEQQSAVPLVLLAAGAAIEIVGGVVVFLTDQPLLALALFMVGIVCLGAAGDALRGA